MMNTKKEVKVARVGRSFVRNFNRYNIINTIRAAGMISRIDIARNLGLSKASLSAITAELIKEGLILEKEEGPNQVGRRPILLAMNPTGIYAVGVNISMEMVEAVIINALAEAKTSYSMQLDKDYYLPEELSKIIAETTNACISKSGLPNKKIAGVGISIPGLVDSASGIIRYMPNYGWMDVDLRKILQLMISYPLFIDNDANTMTIAEHWFGDGRGLDNIIVIVLENGVGSGYVLNGSLVRGSIGIAGEFGHMSINDDGPQCRCGKSGCIEAYAGINAIIRDSLEIANGEIWKGYSKKDITFSEIIEKAKDGIPELKELFDRAGKALGFGIAQLIIILNPGNIIITGSGTMAGNLLFKPMFESIKRSLSLKLSKFRTNILIKPSTNEAFARGAGTLVLQEIYKPPAVKY